MRGGCWRRTDLAGIHLAREPPSFRFRPSSIAISGGACPAGCSSWQGALEVPVGEGLHRAAIALPVPLAPAPSAGPAPRVDADVKPRPRGPAGIVTTIAFARWLGTHPEWAPEAARAAEKADAAYLSGWEGTTPPAGKSGAAVVSVSWAAASAYCAGRGGLPGLEDGALTWTESPSQPWHEYRSAAGRPAWRRSDGATSVAVKASESGTFIGFRCAR